MGASHLQQLLLVPCAKGRVIVGGMCSAKIPEVAVLLAGLGDGLHYDRRKCIVQQGGSAWEMCCARMCQPDFSWMPNQQGSLLKWPECTCY